MKIKWSRSTQIAIGVLILTISLFLSFLRRQENNFSEIIKNHIHHETEAMNKLEQSNIKMTAVLEQLIQWLQRNNKQ